MEKLSRKEEDFIAKIAADTADNGTPQGLETLPPEGPDGDTTPGEWELSNLKFSILRGVRETNRK